VAELRPVVSNTTPLINLAGVGLLDLLPRLYGAIMIAEAVLAEYEAKAHRTDPVLRAAPWLTTSVVELPEDLTALLDAGEAATIVLAEQVHPHLVLFDERRGRRIALARGLPVIGTGAVLVEAKRQGLIPAVAPVLDAMVTQGRYISERLRATLLAAADESDHG
jgi:predicted nucleic acid-binding protein